MEDLKIIRDVEAIKAISNSIRLKMLRILKREGSASATQLADEMGESASKISYHLKILEEHGILELKETRVKGNLVEKIYSPVARAFKLEIMDESQKENMERSQLLPLVSELSSALEKDLHTLAEAYGNIEEDSSSVLSYGTYFLTETERDELEEHIMGKLRQYMDRRRDEVSQEHAEYKIAFLLLDHFSRN